MWGLTGFIGLVGPMVEQAVFLDNISNAILVGPNQLSSIYNLLVEACRILDMAIPSLYVRQNPTPNAYSVSIKVPTILK